MNARSSQGKGSGIMICMHMEKRLDMRAHVLGFVASLAFILLVASIWGPVHAQDSVGAQQPQNVTANTSHYETFVRTREKLPLASHRHIKNLHKG